MAAPQTMKFERVGLVSKPRRPDIEDLAPALIQWIRTRGLECRYDLQTAQYLGVGDGLSREHLAEAVDLILVLGGDGTLLAAARATSGRNIPLLAVNLGGLGFLMTTGPHELYGVLDSVLHGHYHIQCRTMLRGHLLRRGETIASYDALNDVVVNKAAMARVIDMDAYVDEEFVCSYRADGLIISTPTGSTAYSLSAGGPVIFPSVEALVVTPICPHTLTNRPVVLPNTAQVEVVLNSADDSSYLTVDGQVGKELHSRDRVRCSASPHRVHLIQPERLRFFEVLRNKMKWGER
jgi:NAD+ kinase